MSKLDSFADFTVIIPTWNEAENIEKLATQLVALYPEIWILVVDDVSHDGTQTIVRELGRSNQRIALLERTGASARGLTASVIDGIEAIKTKYFVVMDGDLQHPPEIVGKVCIRLTEGAALVAGARLPYHEDRPWHRTVITWFATIAAKVYLYSRGIQIADPMSGFFGGATELVRETCRNNPSRFEPKGYKVLFDLLRVIDRSIEIDQVFYRFGVRPGGNSKLRAAHVFYYLRSLLR